MNKPISMWMKSKPYRALLVSVVVVILATAPLFGQAKRVALVIGNSSYLKIQALNNPVNDAVDMTAALKRLGFTVLTKTDADRKTMRTVIDDFNKAIQGADVALFYYSGHGVQLDNENYLVPVGAEVSVAGDVQDECVSLSRITARMNEAGAGTNIIILDACRDNPFKAVTRGIERGLAVITQKPPESIIVYATAENERAEDGGGRNGTFTSALLKNIERPESFTDILTEVKAQVRKETSEKQQPAVYDSLSHHVYLAGSGSTPAPAVTVVPVQPAVTPTITVSRSYGSLSITTATAGTLYLDGKAMADIPAGANAKVDSVEVGSRSLELRYTDGQVEQHTVTVEAGSAARVSFIYRKAPPAQSGQPAVAVAGQTAPSAQGGSAGQATDFFKLVKNGTPQDVQAAIKQGADVIAQDRSGWTALMWAAALNRDPEVIMTLVKAGANLNAQNKMGDTPLMLAVMYNQPPEVIATLLEVGADAKIRNSISGKTAFDYAHYNAILQGTDALKQLEEASK